MGAMKALAIEMAEKGVDMEAVWSRLARPCHHCGDQIELHISTFGAGYAVDLVCEGCGELCTVMSGDHVNPCLTRAGDR